MLRAHSAIKILPCTAINTISLTWCAFFSLSWTRVSDAARRIYISKPSVLPLGNCLRSQSSLFQILQSCLCAYAVQEQLLRHIDLHSSMLWTFSFTGFCENLMLVILRNASLSFVSVDLFDSAHWISVCLTHPWLHARRSQLLAEAGLKPGKQKHCSSEPVLQTPKGPHTEYTSHRAAGKYHSNTHSS